MKQRVSLLAGVVLLSLPAVIPEIIWPGKVIFDPATFVEEYVKFLGGLATTFCGFYLVYVYWLRKEHRDRLHYVRTALVASLRLLRSALEGLEEVIRRPRDAQSFTRDNELVREHMRLADDAVDQLADLLGGAGDFAHDRRLAVARDTYHTSVAPTLRQLTGRSIKTRDDIDAQVSVKIADVRARLTELIGSLANGR